MIRYLLKRFRKSERGAALVEFAIVIPVLLLLVMGILEFGWVFNGWIMLTGAAREGARIAVLAADNNATAIAAVQNHSTTFSSPPAVVINRAIPETVTVNVTGNLTPLVGFFRNGDYVITVDASMRKEYLD